MGAEIRHARRVAGIGYGKRGGVFPPIVPDAVGIVRSRGKGVIARTQIAAESEGHCKISPGRRGPG